jgi:hypothetical protein
MVIEEQDSPPNGTARAASPHRRIAAVDKNSLQS